MRAIMTILTDPMLHVLLLLAFAYSYASIQEPPQSTTIIEVASAAHLRE